MAFLAKLLGIDRVAAIVIAALAGMTAIAGFIAYLQSSAVTADRAKTGEAFGKVRDKADTAQDTVQTCKSNWNREKGKCDVE